MTNAEMAQSLGVALRTVASWHERPTVVVRTELQRALDTVYERATEADKVRFARQVRAEDAADDRPGTTDTVVPLAVAVAVVVAKNDVLIVCRREDDPSGITWQFPAGVVKPGLNPSTIAVRETLAETGVHCIVRAELGSRIHPLSRVHCDYFLCEYLAGTVENRDTSENMSAIFVARQDLTRFIPADRIYPPILRALELTDDRAGR
jgi:ADP-ribose pyrophosphatase YjhB (NUDIX family)